jgi:hypothetical protein
MTERVDAHGQYELTHFFLLDVPHAWVQLLYAQLKDFSTDDPANHLMFRGLVGDGSP